MKYLLILLAALLLSSATPVPAAAVQERPSQVTISAVVYGTYPSGVTGPIGEYTAVGASLGEATTNAQALEQQIRTTATAQAAP
jgi:hypothetical protein